MDSERAKRYKEKHPSMEWKDVAGMRDKLVHDYLGVDIDAIWDTVKRDLPVLKNEIESVMKELPQM